ncbi:MAG: MraY family glycosyltransferase, partial [Planctomycetota bacterium]
IIIMSHSSLRSTRVVQHPVLVTLAGAQLGFLWFNFHPARIFLGSSGSLVLGYLLAVSTLRATYLVGEQDRWLAPTLTPLCILAVPIYDTISVIAIRLFSRRSIALGDQSHFHHRLRRLGFSHLQTVVFIWIIALTLALSGVRLIGSTLESSILIMIQALAILSILILAERVAARARQEVFRRRRLRNQPGDSDIFEPVADEVSVSATPAAAATNGNGTNGDTGPVVKPPRRVLPEEPVETQPASASRLEAEPSRIEADEWDEAKTRAGSTS